MKSTGVRLVLHTIANRQGNVIFIAGINDSLALLAIHRHWLFTPHVLTCIRGLYREVFVRTGWCNNVNNINIIIVRNIIHCAIGIHIAFFNTVLALPLGYFTFSARDNAAQFTVIGVLKRRREQIGTVIT
tara:strand:+ start:2633 stop:3022 length:390 start_codon:yes stop_codon:yes gene_type:complete